MNKVVLNFIGVYYRSYELKYAGSLDHILHLFLNPFMYISDFTNYFPLKRFKFSFSNTYLDNKIIIITILFISFCYSYNMDWKSVSQKNLKETKHNNTTYFSNKKNVFRITDLLKKRKLNANIAKRKEVCGK